MSEPLHSIDDLFSKSIEDHTEQPSVSAWKNIAAGLDQENINYPRKNNGGIQKLFFVLLLLLTGIIIHDLNQKANKNDIEGNAKKNTESSGENKKQPAINNNEPRSNDIINEKVKPSEIVTAEKTSTRKDNDFHQISSVAPEQKLNNDGSTGSVYKKSLPIIAKQENTEQHENIQTESYTITLPKPLKNIKTDTNKDVKEDNNLQVNNKISSIQSDISGKTENVQTPAIAIQKNAITQIAKDIAPKPADKTTVATEPQILIKKKNQSQFGITAFFSPNLTSNRLEDDEPHRVGGRPGEDHNDIKRQEHNDFSFTGGLLIDYSLNKKWTLQSGITLSASSSVQDAKKVYADNDNNGNVRYRINCSAGYTYVLPKSTTNPAVGDSIVMHDSKNRLKYVNIPVTVKYTIGGNKLSVGLQLGGQMNLLLNGKTSAVFDKGTTGESTVTNSIEGLKKFYIDGVSGLTAEYQLNKKISLIVSPTAKVALTSINSGASVKSHPNSFGAAAGIKINF